MPDPAFFIFFLNNMNQKNSIKISKEYQNLINKDRIKIIDMMDIWFKTLVKWWKQMWIITLIYFFILFLLFLSGIFTIDWILWNNFEYSNIEDFINMLSDKYWSRQSFFVDNLWYFLMFFIILLLALSVIFLFYYIQFILVKNLIWNWKTTLKKVIKDGKSYIWNFIKINLGIFWIYLIIFIVIFLLLFAHYFFLKYINNFSLLITNIISFLVWLILFIGLILIILTSIPFANFCNFESICYKNKSIKQIFKTSFELIKINFLNTIFKSFLFLLIINIIVVNFKSIIWFSISKIIWMINYQAWYIIWNVIWYFVYVLLSIVAISWLYGLYLFLKKENNELQIEKEIK